MVRAIGLLIWKPQYTQELVQELVIYSGINMEMVLPKRSSVYFCLVAPSAPGILLLRGDERHKVVHIAMFLAKSAEHITFGLGVDGFGGFFPIYFSSSSENIIFLL